MSFLPFKIPLETITAPGSVALDAFGRLRVSNPKTVFDSQFHFDKQPLIWSEATVAAGAAAYNSNQNAVELTCSTGATDSIVRQTFDRHYYQPGKSQLILCTGLFGAPKTGTRKRIGFFDANDGLFLEIDGTTAKVVKRSATSGSPVDTTVSQASWNIDPMDGTGPSGITLDFNATQILAIDLEWLGVGAVRFAFVVGGVLYPVHRFQHANAGLAVPYMRRACLPIRYELTNTAAPASGTTLRQICSTVISEGGQDPIGIARSSNVSKNISSGDGIVPFVSVRLKSTALASKIMVNGLSFAGDASTRYIIQLWRNPTLTSPTWTSVGADSIAEISTNGTTAITGGTLLRSWASIGSSSDLNVELSELMPGGAGLDGTPIHITLAALKSAGGGADHTAALNWKELQ